MAEFAEWDSFYVIVASAAGALIGLQFVVMALIAEKPPKDAAGASAAFATPTIVHFSASLLLSALMRAPWPALVFPAAIWGLMGLAGVAYTAVVAWRMRKQIAYRPGFEDWLFHIALPALSYGLLVFAPFAVRAHTVGGLFVVAAVALLLLFIGIHNAWDAVAYHVLVKMHGPKGVPHHRSQPEKEKK